MNLRDYAIVFFIWYRNMTYILAQQGLPFESILLESAEMRFYHHRRLKNEGTEIHEFCREQGEGLVQLHTPTLETFNAFKNYLKKKTKYTEVGYWLAYKDDENEGDWYTPEKVPVPEYYRWKDGEPNGSKEQNCLCLKHESINMAESVNMAVYDVDCDLEENMVYAACYRKISPPTIEFVEEQECSNVLNIQWKPDNESLDLKYRITVEPEENTHNPIIRDERVMEKGTRTTSISEVKRGNIYNIVVSVCIDECCCGMMRAVHKTEKKFGGNAPPLLNPHIKQIGICHLTWEVPEGIAKEDVISTKLTLASSPAHLRDVSEDALNKREIVRVEGQLEHLFKPEANREYVVWGQLETCGGFGDKIQIEGKCSGNTKLTTKFFVPKTPNPSIVFVANGLKVQIGFPDDNSPVGSCIFLLIQPMPANARMESSGYSNDYKIEDLKAASGNPPGTKTPYIASALERSKITRDFVEIALGMGETTTCSVGAGNPIKGQNYEIKSEWSYSFFVVTSTPTSKDKPTGFIDAIASVGSSSIVQVLSRSASCEMSSSLLIEAEENPGSSPDITVTGPSSGCSSAGNVIAGILGFLFFVVVGASGFYVAKSKKSKEDGEKDEEEEEEKEEGEEEKEDEDKETQENDDTSRKPKKKKHKDKEQERNKEQSEDKKEKDESHGKSHRHHGHKRHRKRKEPDNA